MNILVMMMYTLKVNIFQIIVHNCRTHSISLNFIDSSIFESSPATNCPEDFADGVFWAANVTDIPIQGMV